MTGKPGLSKKLDEFRRAISGGNGEEPVNAVAQTSLRDLDKTYHEIVDKANDGILVLQDGLIRFSNKSLLELFPNFH